MAAVLIPQGHPCRCSCHGGNGRPHFHRQIATNQRVNVGNDSSNQRTVIRHDLTNQRSDSEYDISDHNAAVGYSLGNQRAMSSERVSDVEYSRTNHRGSGQAVSTSTLPRGYRPPDTRNGSGVDERVERMDVSVTGLQESSIPPAYRKQTHFNASEASDMRTSIGQLFLRRHFAVPQLLWAGLDPDRSRFQRRVDTVDGALNQSVFGVIFRQQLNSTQNTCLVFAELDEDQPAQSIVNFLNNVLLQ